MVIFLTHEPGQTGRICPGHLSYQAFTAGPDLALGGAEPLAFLLLPLILLPEVVLMLPRIMFLVLALAATPAFAKGKKPVAPPPIPTFPLLDKDAAQAAEKAPAFASADDCLPLHVRDQGVIGILFLQCSKAAQDKDGDEVQITENFKAPAAIARRVNFWRRVYSLWGKDQYVMHLSQYPEVVVEAYDVSRVDEAIGPVRREILVKAVAKHQRDQYRNLFLAMHRLRKDEAQFSPAMKRLATAMAHLKDGDKYLIAARTLRLQRGQRDFIAIGLAVAPKYLPAIEQEFKAQGLPVEISRLAFVESSFNMNANSKVGAAGIYQIMPATGRQYLKLGDGLDERRDPIKASRAAAKLLKLNYDMTGRWPLAITAYNHGVGGVRRAVKAVGSPEIIDLINRYYGPAFGFASKNFYSSFLAVLWTLKDSDRLFPEVPKIAAMEFDNIRLDKALTIAQVRKKYNLSQHDLGEFNPDILRPVLVGNGTLPRGYVLKVPAKKPLVPNT